MTKILAFIYIVCSGWQMHRLLLLFCVVYVSNIFIIKNIFQSMGDKRHTIIMQRKCSVFHYGFYTGGFQSWDERGSCQWGERKNSCWERCRSVAVLQTPTCYPAPLGIYQPSWPLSLFLWPLSSLFPFFTNSLFFHLLDSGHHKAIVTRTSQKTYYFEKENLKN